MMYDRGPAEPAEVVLDWDHGVSWVAHPNETGKRASHALVTDDGVWLIDPLGATNLDALIEPLGNVVGVAVLSAWHTRDAGPIAERYDVSVHIPTWMGRVESRVNGPVNRVALAPVDSITLFSCRPFPLWDEAFWYHRPTDTLVIPDSLGTVPHWLIGGERLGLPPFRRLQPPEQLCGLTPERILVCHGEPIVSNAPEALETALCDARRQFPRSLFENGPTAFRGVMSALRS